MLFGGIENRRFRLFNDTWEFDNTNWIRHPTTHAPSPRGRHAMVFDSVRRRYVLFGGLGATLTALGDTWEFDGVDWIQRALARSPSPRTGAAYAFDPIRGRTVIFGGFDLSTIFGDTWEFDGNE